jgi:hypothetical protein
MAGEIMVKVKVEERVVGGLATEVMAAVAMGVSVE